MEPDKTRHTSMEHVGSQATNLVEITSETSEVTLRQYSLRDCEEAFALIDSNREHLSQFGDETSAKYPTLESFRESILNPKNPRRLRFGVRNRQGVLVGSINVTPDDDSPERGEIGYYLGQEFQKKGYTTEAIRLLTDYAFEHLGYQTLYGVVTEDNDASTKALERVGYQETEKRDGKIVLSKDKQPTELELSEFEVGRVIRETDNYRVLMGWKPGLEDQEEGKRFFIEPKTDDAQVILTSAAKAHNIDNFNVREVSSESGTKNRRCLRADFTVENLPSLLQGKVEIPKEGEDTIPPPDRMEECIKSNAGTYSFS